MTAFTETELDAVTSAAEQNSNSTFERVLGQFYGYTSGSNIAEKRPRGRPPKLKPVPPAGIIKNEISDEESDELWIDTHDLRLLRMEFRQLTVEDGIPETDAIEDLAKIYGLAYKAVFKAVND